MVVYRASDAETPLSSPPSFTCSLESTIVPPMAPATPLNPSFVNNLSLSRLNQANPANLTMIDNLSRLVLHPANVPGNHPFAFASTRPFSSITREPVSDRTTRPFSNPLSLFGNPFQSPRPRPYSNPTDHVLGRNQSALSTHTPTSYNPQQFPITSVDLEHNQSQSILSQHSHDVQRNNQSDPFAHAHHCYRIRPSLNTSNSYRVNGEFLYMQQSFTTGNSSMLRVPHDHQITGKSDQPVINADDLDDENTKAMASLVVETPLVGTSILTGEQNTRKSLVVEKPTAETALVSEKTLETSLMSDKLVHGTNSVMLGKPEETQSPPATQRLMGSGSVKSSKKQRENSLKLKFVLPLTRSQKTVDVVKANEADVSGAENAKKSAVNNEGIETEQPERKTPNLRSRGAADKAKNVTNRQESSMQTRSRTGKQVKPAPSKFSLTLSKEEIEADFLAMTGSKPPKKPKKRAKNLQRQLDRKFPGLWLGSVSTQANDHADIH